MAELSRTVKMVTDWFDPSDENRDQDEVAPVTRKQASRSDAVLSAGRPSLLERTIVTSDGRAGPIQR